MPLQCSAGNFKYAYNSSAVSQDRIQISANNMDSNETLQILKPEAGLRYTEAITINVELTPFARISELQISMEAQNAESVTFITDNALVAQRTVVGI